MFRAHSKHDKCKKKARISQASKPVDEKTVDIDIEKEMVRDVVKKQPKRRVRISTDVLRSRAAMGDVIENEPLPDDEIVKIIQNILCTHNRYYYFHAVGDENVKNRLGVKEQPYIEINDTGTFVGVIGYAKKCYIESINRCAGGRYLDAYYSLRRIPKILSGDFLYDLEAAALSARAKMAAGVVLNLSKMGGKKAAAVSWEYFLINDQVVQMFVNVLMGVQKLLLGDKFYGNFLSKGIAVHFDDNFRGLFFREIKVFDYLVLMLAIHMPRYLLPPTVIELGGSLYGNRGMVASESRINIYDAAEKVPGLDAGRCHQHSCEKIVFNAFGIKDWYGLSGVNWSEHNDSKQLLGKAVHVMYLVHSLFGHFLPLENYEIASVDADSLQSYVTTQLFVLREMLSPKCENYTKLLELQTLYKDDYSFFQPILSEFITGIRAVTLQIKELSAELQADDHKKTPKL